MILKKIFDEANDFIDGYSINFDYDFDKDTNTIDNFVIVIQSEHQNTEMIFLYVYGLKTGDFYDLEEHLNELMDNLK